MAVISRSRKLINLRTAPDYKVREYDLGKYIRVKAEYSDQKDNNEIVFTESVLIEPYINTGAATFRIKGEPEVGELLEVYQYSSDPDGNDINTPIYQWYKSDNLLDWRLAGYGSTYRVRNGDKFRHFKVRAFYEDLKGFSEDIQTDSIQITLPINEGSANFLIKGTPAVDGLLEAYQSSNDPDGNYNESNFAVLPSFTWQASSDGITWRTVDFGPSFSPNASYKDKLIRLITRYVDTDGFQENQISEPVLVYLPVNEGAATIGIHGIPSVGEVLEVYQTSNDPDGNGEFEFEWQRSIDGKYWNSIASGSQYRLQEFDRDKHIRVKALYEDSEGFNELILTNSVLISLPINEGASFAISGTPEVGGNLEAYQISNDPDGNSEATHRWFSSTDKNSWTMLGIGDVYIPRSIDKNKHIRMRSDYTDLDGFEEQVYSQPVFIDLPINRGAAGYSINGVPAPGELLEVIQDENDPNGNGQAQYRWQASSDGINGWQTVSSGLAYQVREEDKNKFIRVRVDYVDLDGFRETTYTHTINISLPINIGKAEFSITGIPSVGETIEINQLTNDPNGNGNLHYQWQTYNEIGDYWQNISEGPSLSLQESHISNRLRAEINYIDLDGFNEKSYTDEVKIVNISDDANQGSAQFEIKGESIIGETLEVIQLINDPDGNGEPDYQWQSSSDNGVSWSPVSTNHLYNLSSNDESSLLRVRATYTDERGYNEVSYTDTLEIGDLDPMKNGGSANYTISGQPMPGETLEVLQLTNDPDGNGLPNYLWQKSSNNGQTWLPLSSGEMYKIDDLDVGNLIRLRAAYIDLDGFDEISYTEPVIISQPIDEIDDGDARFTIVGEAKPGELIEIVQDLNDPDGNGEPHYQWQIYDEEGNYWSELSEGPSLLLEESHLSRKLRAKVSYTDDNGFSENIYTNELNIANKEGKTNQGSAKFEIKGKSLIGERLEVIQLLNDPDGNGEPDYEWQSSSDNGVSWSPVGTNNIYILSSNDESSLLRVQATYTDERGFNEISYTDIISIGDFNPTKNGGSAAFTISGQPFAGEILEVLQVENDPDGNGVPSYLWQSSDNDGQSWQPLSSGNFYKITDLDTGRLIRLRAAYIDLDGFNEITFTEPIMVSEPIEVRDDGDASFTIIGTTRPGEKLEIVQDSNDPDGNGELSYQWQLSLDHGLSWNNISSDPTYQLHEANRSGLLRSLVSYRDEEGFDEAIYTNTLDLSQNINLGSGTFEISGQPYIGNTLEAFQSHYDPDGDGNVLYTWQISLTNRNGHF